MLKRWAELRRNNGGVAAIEFALIAPVLVTLLLGTIELCNALSCRQKVTMLASTGADLVAQATSMSASDMTNVFSAVNAIIYPFPATKAKIVISSIVSDGNGGGTVDWSDAQNTSALTPGNAASLPAGLMPKTQCAAGACSVIYAKVTYDYTSPFGKFFVGTVPLTESFYAKPRRSATVTCNGC
jgi:Flp pilus assembly protein TadG